MSPGWTTPTPPATRRPGRPLSSRAAPSLRVRVRAAAPTSRLLEDAARSWRRERRAVSPADGDQVEDPQRLATPDGGGRAGAGPEGGARLREQLLQASSCNREAAQLLRAGRSEDAPSKLLEVEGLLDQIKGYSPILDKEEEEETSNQLAKIEAECIANWGAYHRHLRNYAVAVQCCAHALRLQLRAKPTPRALMMAHFNLATCQLEARCPVEALDNANAAVSLAGQAISSDGAAPAEEGFLPVPQAGQREEDYAMLAVAYHKVGEAHEALRKWSRASFAYQQAHEVVQKSLGARHPLVRALGAGERSPRPVATPRIRTAGGTRLPGRQLPLLRGGCSRPCTPGAKLSRSYKLDEETFEPWPPRNACVQEKEWYAMAWGSNGAPPLPGPCGGSQTCEPELLMRLFS